jgi:putative transcriptional regulator
MTLEAFLAWEEGQPIRYEFDGMAGTPDVDLAKVDATTEADIRRHMTEEGYDPDEAIREANIISPAMIRNRLGLSQHRFAASNHGPVATLQNWEHGRTRQEPEAACPSGTRARRESLRLQGLSAQAQR